MLEIKNLVVTKANKIILDNISLKIEDNETVAFTGANGSGKSTLMKVIMGIETPTSGKIFFDGKDITDMSITARANLGISFAFQNPIKFKGLTIDKLFELSAKRKVDKKEKEEVLTSLGLKAEQYLNRELDSSLSGGELKRLEIASILFKNTKCMIFDEPEAGIDLWSFSKLTNVFAEIKQKLNPMLIIVSHQEKLLREMDKIIILDGGKISKICKPSEIMEGVN